MKKNKMIKKIGFLGLLPLILLGYFFHEYFALPNRQNLIPDLSSSSGKSLVVSARRQIGVVTEYDTTNGYYSSRGGDPPPHTGVCSDTVARAFSGISINLRHLINEDISKHKNLYPSHTDENIDYRRVKNLNVYFHRHARVLDIQIDPLNRENLSSWQAGDIVVFQADPPKYPLWHIAIITGDRDKRGVPYMIDNHGYGTQIRITPLDWPTPIVGHYRYF